MHVLRKLHRSFARTLRHHVRRTLTSRPNASTVAEKDTEKTIVVSRIDRVTTIGINRPEKQNSLDITTARLLSEALDEFESNEEAAVAVLHGIGGNFCAGYDLHEIANYDGENEESLPHFGPLAYRNELSKKPLVASLSGYTIGAGFELALMCDLRVVEDTAMIGFLNRRFGIPILSGGTVRLPAMIGYSRAMELILTGRLLSAEEMFNWGLANKITSYGTALGSAVNLAKSLVKFPPKTLLADRASTHFATFSAKQMDEALQFEKDNASHLVFEEGVSGAKTFVEDGIGKHGKTYNITPYDKSIREIDETLL
ncbi:uncharacterized protein LOC105181211 [Harpegnathos saltator]|uniref:Carnitinyl-CoA dehydratase n=1 Tax=Harpegnathos saltator TaxID=610380 RepID=E2BC82_HARSA|nr:uncharacterized protein LOC105181211 [Harpegnathos saltator]EFN86709.1 Carnitinyl-CoA dehydratase [Harpegnathos saltator]